MAKVDFKKQLKHLYQPSAKDVSVVDVPDMNFLMVDGKGDPATSPGYMEALETLYTMAYQLKFTIKGRDPELDYVIPPPEGLWWAKDMAAFSTNDRDAWLWTAMIMQPDHVTQALFDEAVDKVKKKKDLPGLGKLRLERYHEGRAVQIMHLGPYSALGPAVERLYAFARENGYRLWGKYHEIYLSDPRRTAPEKIKTVIRQPVQ
jgi:hypothetical protein